MVKPFIKIGDRKIGEEFSPLVIAEIGINHEGNIAKAKRMILDAYHVGAECVKFQSHVVEDEMIPEARKVIPGNAKESIYDIMERCALTQEEEIETKRLVESLGMIYLCTPFSRAAADRLHEMGVSAFKIGSGECNSYPLIKHIASFKKPIILSTGMNSLDNVSKSVKILEENDIQYALLHCTSMYPTPYNKVRLGALNDMREKFPNAVLGLSDHSLGIYTCLGAIPFGASILEKHFTSDRRWPGPDVPISVDPTELEELIKGSRAIHEALGGKKEILPEEQVTIDFAYSCVVSTAYIPRGELFSMDNLWVKRPGTGEIKAESLDEVIGRYATRDIEKDTQLKWGDTTSEKYAS
nr:polyhydroxyalkanoate biosynthesis repressor PhaR [Nanoarchaeum sp.]